MTAKRPAPAKPAARRRSSAVKPAKAAGKARKATKKASGTKKAPAAPRRRRFGARGQRLWDAHREQVDGERGLVMLEEACRIADRLDRLDALLRGDPELWCELVDTRAGSVELRVDGALIEARQQANVLRQIVAALPLKEADPAGDQDDWLEDL